jgi:hypothetical protein
MRDIDEAFAVLRQSRFRSRFHLSAKEVAYLEQKGLATVLEHARNFITTRLAAAKPLNDGRQTPIKNHPVFVAQHATATCCRKCLEKWHHIPKNVPLMGDQIDYIVSLIEHWLINQSV